MSKQTNQLPDNAPFGHQQKVAINALLPTVTPQQAGWLGGYFSALSQVLGGATAPTSAAATAPVTAAPQATVPLTILYGSESGNAEKCADDTLRAAQQAGFKAKIIDMGDYNYADLEKEKNVLIIVSTWGEGDPPERATSFHEFVMGDSAPSLKDVNFSVCALGDTSYADFCECGKQFDKRFEELGANRIHPRVDCDVDFDDVFKGWLDAVIPKMVEVAGVKETTATTEAPAAAEVADFGLPAVAVEEGYSKKNPFPAEVKEVINLNGRGSKKHTAHIELSLEGSGLSYEPGDVIGIFPSNSPVVVDDMLRLAGFRGDEIREEDNGSIVSLFEILETGYDITSLNANFMKKYAPFAKSKQLDSLLKEENKAQLTEYLWGREIRDLFLDYPPAEHMSPEQLTGLLRKMPPRLYSIASSLRAHPDEVHLTVGAVRYNAHNHDRMGVCSTYICDRLNPGDKVNLFVHHNKNFFLPEDPDTPIIMVGPGTGIAPFRSFVEDRSVTGAKGKSWLFFGDQHFSTDFLYQTEWQSYLKQGTLSRMDVAFSRDTDQKIYVQDRMREKAKELYAWMQEGAYFYVCGDASRMAKDVHNTLIKIFETEGGLKPEEAEAKVKELQKEKRYQRDVY